LNNYQYVPNPTGWVDPLGLNNCPGQDLCNPNLNSSLSKDISYVNDGEPQPASPESKYKYLYRGDTRSQDIIFEDGFKSKGDSNDLQLHVYDNNEPPSNFISTSTSPEVGIDFGTAYRTKPGYLYTLRLLKGIDVNNEKGLKVPFPDEKEIAVPKEVKREDILGVTPLKADGSYKGYSIPNPRRI